MKQVIENIRTGKIEVVDVPIPHCDRNQVLIATKRSLISAGTERMLVEFGRANFFEKAKSRPDQVRRVFEKIRTDGLIPTIDAVLSRLNQPLPLGYSNSGVVVDLGENVEEFSIGDRVVSNGPHAEYVCVTKNLVAKVPDNVSDEEAAFTVLAAVGLQGVRLAHPSLGENVAVIGLGLIGLMIVQLLIANGCRVLGIDFDPQRLKLAEDFGAEIVNLSNGEDPVKTAASFTNGKGMDAVIIAASTRSNEPVHQAALMSRKRGRIILVGVTGLQLRREDFYEKELIFQVSSSYGPGRYDPNYEIKGQDYPYGYVRWTAQRNFQAVLNLMSENRLNVKPLISHHFPIEKAYMAYDLILSNKEPFLGIVLTYSDKLKPNRHPIIIKEKSVDKNKDEISKIKLGVLGAGNFAFSTLFPVLKGLSDLEFAGVFTASGLSACNIAKKFNFKYCASREEELFEDQDINTILILTRHNLHANQIIKSLRSKKNVFCEKPLCINKMELENIVYTYLVENKEKFKLMVGFNRRFAPMTIKLKDFFKVVKEPIVINYRINAGFIPQDHWVQDKEIGGGRIIGEVCHFVDFMVFLTDSLPNVVYAQAVPNNGKYSNDNVIITIKFDNGSIGSIVYVANGDKSYPKERVEVFGGGRVGVLDNFRKIELYEKGKRRKYSSFFRPDKGYKNEWKAFIDSLKNGKEPIKFEDLVGTTLTTFSVLDSIKKGEPVSINVQDFIWRIIEKKKVQ